MNPNSRLGLSALAAVLFGLTAAAQAKARLIAPPQATPAQAVLADAIVIGKVTEVEADAVEVTTHPGAPKDQKTAFKVAVLKIDEALMGASGLTRFRVGFPADAPPALEPGKPGGPLPGGGRIRRPGVLVALTPGMEGCFVLTRYHDGDFYVLAGPPLQKKADNFDKELEKVKKVIKAIDDPVAALKAKDLADRFQAALVVLQRYQSPRGVRPGRPASREPIPEEENKLIVSLLKELPWITADAPPGATEQQPNRSALWYLINPAEIGYKDPAIPAQGPGDAPVDHNKIMDEASTKFLKVSGDKIRIKRFVQK